MKENHFTIHNDPNGHELWCSISGNFQRFPEIINEFVDDALSNFRATKPDQRRVEIRLRQWEEFVDVSVVDTGTGIRDIHAALTLGNRSGGETNLNEHGMGLKHALASACEDGSWSIQSRTPEDNTQDRHLVVRGPYRLGDDPMTGYYLPGRGVLLGPTGTAVSFTCTHDFFATLRPAGDRTDKPFEVLVDILLEELGYTYAPILGNGEMEMAVVVGDHVYPVEPVFPTWNPNCFKETPPTVLDLGGGPVTVNCCWGLIRADKDNHIYYRGNMESSGVEIRCNGRVMERGLDKRIWIKQPHPSRNHFLAVVELTAEGPGAFPPTRPTKTGFRDGDPRLEKLFAWLRANVAPAGPQESVEKRLTRALEKRKQQEPDVMRTALEENTYCSLNLRVKMDLFVSRGDQTEVYESKKGPSKALDLYQLRMYWDGCAVDGRPLSRGILVARNHPREVQNLVSALNNSYRDPTGQPYHLSLLTWEEVGIDPKAV